MIEIFFIFESKLGIHIEYLRKISTNIIKTCLRRIAEQTKSKTSFLKQKKSFSINFSKKGVILVVFYLLFFRGFC